MTKSISIKKEILKYAGPGILGLVANSLYIVVDGIFVAKMLGSDALAAVTIVVPVVEILIAISLMISIGTGILISISKGKKDVKKSRSYFNHGLLLMLLLSFVILILSVLFRKQIVTSLGATADIFDSAIEYFTWFIVFVPFFTLNYALGTWIRNDGKPNLAMIGQVIGALLNIVLDYVFMGPLKMGLAGAAIATGLGPVIGVIILAPHFLKKKGSLYIEKITIKWAYIKEILVSGLPSFSIEFALGTMSFLCNLFIAHKMGAEGLAAFGVIGYINLILLSVFLGLGQGTQPLVSRFQGEQNYSKIKEVYKFVVKFSIILGIVGYVLILISKRSLVGIFINPNDNALTELSIKAIALFFFSFSLTGVNIATASIFEAKHSVKYSIIISVLRAIGFLLPTLLILSQFSNNMLLWIAVPIAELITLPVSLILWKKDNQKDIKIKRSLNTKTVNI